MAVVKEDLIAGNNSRLGFNGWEFSRTFNVSELTGPGYAMGLEAYTDPGVPKMNDSHPSISDAYVVDVAPESLANVGNAINLIYTYRQFTSNVRVSISSRRVSVDRNTYLPDQSVDVRAEMVLGYQYPSVGDDNYSDIYEPVTDDDGVGLIDEQGVTVAVAETKTDFTYSRTEWLTNSADAANGYAVGIQLTGNILKDRARLFNDKLSLNDWIVSPGEQYLWKCEIDAESSGNGFDWRVRYKFSYDEFGWAYRGTFTDGITNQPVSDGSTAVTPAHAPSIKEFDQYQTINFNLLGIT